MTDSSNDSAKALLAAAALALMFGALALSSSLEHSLTWDEPSYIGAGYLYLTQGDFRYNPSHPPLLQELVALPLLFMDLNVPDHRFEYWESLGNPIVGFAYKLIYGSGNNPLRIAFWSRLPIILLGVVLTGAVYLWARKLYGPTAALVGTTLVAFSPNLIAHGGLATEDFGCACLMFVSVFSFWHASRRRTLGAWAVCGLLTGMALVSKFTACLLAPTYVLLTGALWIRRDPFARSPKSVGLAAGTIAACCAILIVVCYGLTLDLSVYLRGLQSLYGDLKPGYQYYLAGQFGEARWYYAMAAFLMKTPVSTLLLLITGLWLTRRRGHGEAALFLLIPAGVVVIASWFDSANLGLRRILPAFPFLLTFASVTLARPRSSRLLSAVVVLLVCWSVQQAVWIHPHYLSYFNTAVGGPSAGPSLLDDSNIDWGQDLPALAKWQREHLGDEPLTLLYFGSADPAAYGVRAIPMQPIEITHPRRGVYAVSVHLLIRFKRSPGQLTDWLKNYKPIGRAGWSIYLYRFD